MNFRVPSAMTSDKLRSIAASACFLIIISFFSVDCIRQPLEPVAPTWDVQLSVPLVDTTRTVNEIVQKDPSLFQINATNNLLSYVDTKPVFSDSIDDRIKLSPQGSRLGVRVGSLKISNVQIRDSVPLFPVGTYPVPPETLSFSARQLSVTEFSNVTFDSGIVRLVITNDLPIAISFPYPITIKDSRDSTVAVFSGIAGTIPANGGTGLDSSDLAGKSTTSAIRIAANPTNDSVTIGTPGSATPVQFTSTSLVRFQLQLMRMKVSSATARIPTQQIFSLDSTTFVADDLTFVDSAFFKSGSFTINLINQVNLTVRARLRLPQLRKGFPGAVFDSSVILGPREPQRPIIIDLRPPHGLISLTGNPTRFLIYTAELYQVDSTDTAQVTFNSTDSLIASVVISPGTQFIVKSAKAVIEPTALNIDQPQSLRLGDLPSKFTVDSLNLPEANFTLNVTTPVSARVSNLRFWVQKGSILDSVKYVGNPTVNLQPGIVNPIPFNRFNSNIVDVLNLFVARGRVLPDSLRVLGDGLLNPDYDTLTAARLADTSKIAGSLDIDFPMNIGIRNGTFKDTINIADKFRVDQEDIEHLNQARLTVQTFNRIPSALQLTFVLLDANKDSMWVFPRTGSITVNAASVGADGFSNQSIQSIISLTMDKTDVDKLVNAEFLRIAMTINTSSGAQSVKFRTTDSIKLRLWGTLSIRISPGG